MDPELLEASVSQTLTRKRLSPALLLILSTFAMNTIDDLRSAGVDSNTVPDGWPAGIDMTQELFAKMKEGPIARQCEPSQVALGA
jgi:hypothetical protein